MKKGLRSIAMGILLLAGLPLLWGCKQKTLLTAYDITYLDCFDTITTVTIGTNSKEEFEILSKGLHEQIQQYHRLFDIYESYEDTNNIKTINDNAGIRPVVVDKEIIKLLSYAVEQDKKTDGMVNVAMGSVLSIWHDYRTKGLENPAEARIPERELLEAAGAYTDIDSMEIDRERSTVYLPDSSMKLDVGAVAKGYAVDRICEWLLEKGVASAMVSAGGNVRTIGNRPDQKPWRIAIQNPDTSAQKSYLYVANLTDMSLVTSGGYQRFYEVGGRRYHHIINPETLEPWNEYNSVTILCKESKLADALSTAVFNMPLEEGQALIESLEETEALWVTSDNKEVFSSGFKEYLEIR